MCEPCRRIDRIGRTGLIIAAVAPIYITGHRNPDSDSIAAAIGYAELKRRLDPDGDYVPVRLGDCNTQTNWLLERARRRGAGLPLPRDAPGPGRDEDRVPDGALGRTDP